MEVVIFGDGVHDPLYLNNIRIADDGTIKSGFVINGCWNYQVRGGEELAKNGTLVVNRWPAKPRTIVIVEQSKIPRSLAYDRYNAVIEWARSVHEEKHVTRLDPDAQLLPAAIREKYGVKYMHDLEEKLEQMEARATAAHKELSQLKQAIHELIYGNRPSTSNDDNIAF